MKPKQKKSRPPQYHNRVRVNADDYEEWLERKGNYDLLEGSNTWDGHTPWTQLEMSDIEQDRLAALKELYPTLKGRQKQIVALLFDGLTNQSEIARRLGMYQSGVANALKSIMKKILKKVI